MFFRVPQVVGLLTLLSMSATRPCTKSLTYWKTLVCDPDLYTRVPLQCLQDEVADHPAIVHVHWGPEGVEDPGYVHLHALLLHGSIAHDLCDFAPFIVVGSGSYGIHVALVILSLWWTSGSPYTSEVKVQEQTSPNLLCQPQHVQCPEGVGL